MRPRPWIAGGTSGIIAAAGGLLADPPAVPQKVAAEIALTGEPISAAGLTRLGLVNPDRPGGNRARRRARTGGDDRA